MISSVDVYSGGGWRVRDALCDAGPRDRPFVEQNPYVSVALVCSGTFTYRSTHGTALLTPGSLLLNDASAEFECRHEHGTGDRCIAFRFKPVFIESLAAALSISRVPFSIYRIPLSATVVSLQAEILCQLRRPDSLRLEKLALILAEMSLRANVAADTGETYASPNDVERASVIARFIELHYDQGLSLTQLAAVAGLSRFHLLRIFRKTVGVTPYQYVLNIRMREAARKLRSTKLPVTSIAADCGFGDLSEFSRRFKRFFKTSPATYRTIAAQR